MTNINKVTLGWSGTGVPSRRDDNPSIEKCNLSLGRIFLSNMRSQGTISDRKTNQADHSSPSEIIKPKI